MICVVLAIETLPAFTLSCYGGAEVETPYFDQLAAAGITFNHHFADSTSAVCDSHPWMTGKHSFSHAPSNASGSMQERLENTGIQLITLDEDSPSHQNSFSKLIDQAVNTLQQSIASEENQPALLWINARGVSNATEIDEEVALLDAEAGRLFDWVLNANQANDILFVMTAAHGLSDLSHTVSFEQAPLPECLIHTPLIFVAPTLGSAERRLELVQTIDLFPTIVEWFTQQSVEEKYNGTSLWKILRNETNAESNWRESVYIKASDNIFAMRTSDFYLIEKQETGLPKTIADSYLFIKPDDLWDVYNVARQHPQLVDELQQQLHEYFNERNKSQI